MPETPPTLTGATAPAPADAPYRNPALPIPQRVADLVSRMTLPEKVGQMMQLSATTYDDRETDPSTGAPNADLIRELVLGTHVGSILHASPAQLALAHELAATTRLGIPLLIGEDCIHGHSFFTGATIFPTQLAMAASFDPALVEAVARATAVEVAPTGVHWTFSPVLCIARDTRWGRVSETFGEDPYLIGELASAMVRGYQGEGLEDPTAILATAKHFAAYSETQGGRDASEADVSRRKMLSWYTPPFERVAREGCATFMLGYQAIDGVPITINDWLLNETLRGAWGYTGMLVTDWDNVGQLVRIQQIAPDFTDAARRAVLAGNDMIMTTPEFFAGAQAAVAEGSLPEAAIDAAVGRILTQKFALGLFEDPRLPDQERQRAVIGSAAHAELNLEIARRSLVLLENDGALPLPSSTRRLAVVGPNADDPDTTLGDWAGNSGQATWMSGGHPREMISTVLDGARAAGWEVTHARGADILTLGPDPAGAFFPDGQPRPQVVIPAQPDEAMIAEAVAAVRESDAVVAVVGDRIELVGEGRSTATLDLIGGQVALLEAVQAEASAAGKPLIVVVLASKPHVLPEAALRANAIIWAGNPGMRGGQALAELLAGDIEPTGRLPISWPRHVGQLPVFYNAIPHQHGTRYADLTQEPQWVFGQGRSYSTVEYADLRVLTPRVHDGEHVRAVVTVTNTGERPVRETVQVYVDDVVTSVTWAGKELKGVRQVDLTPGASEQVEVSIAVADCSIVTAAGERVVEPGAFRLLVGASSREADLLASEFEVLAD
ncbi:glycoside hydrolase family 3 N-terminal domain-containing protein [Serinibacter salmoneus]|uniref:beta-glucosidase n=1 Tax=Serinibacter salmoneus TaxID=556530 RepID=A0A2A9D300_9MICO|nr:glycoside hydrolase family 3 N-terminal domain-containing protein [Serinibacter salmoneus]PFG21034.1 beta-glucosidase [Serinibacter salmoneus]